MKRTALEETLLCHVQYCRAFNVSKERYRVRLHLVIHRRHSASEPEIGQHATRLDAPGGSLRKSHAPTGAQGGRDLPISCESSSLGQSCTPQAEVATDMDNAVHHDILPLFKARTRLECGDLLSQRSELVQRSLAAIHGRLGWASAPTTAVGAQAPIRCPGSLPRTRQQAEQKGTDRHFWKEFDAGRRVDWTDGSRGYHTLNIDF